jgi:hypothetical protein
LELEDALMGLFFAGAAKHHAPDGATEHEDRFAISPAEARARSPPIGTLFGRSCAVGARSTAALPTCRRIAPLGGRLFTHGVHHAIEGRSPHKMSFAATREGATDAFTEWAPSSLWCLLCA